MPQLTSAGRTSWSQTSRGSPSHARAVMRLSVNITNYSWPGGTAALGPELARVVRAADAGGIDTVWLSDHLIQGDPTAIPDSEMLEAYTALGFLDPM